MSARYRPLVPTGEVLLLWVAIVATCLTSGEYVNEADHLPYARQLVQPDWLPHDFYLNSSNTYRYPFSVVLGILVYYLGFDYAALVGRLLVYLFLAFAFNVFFRSIQLRLSLRLLVLLAFIPSQSLVASEWIIDEAETKSVAYAFVLLALSGFLCKRYLAGFAYAGAALSFHILVGAYAVWCTVGATLLNLRAYRLEWLTMIRQSWPFFLTGAFGFVVAAEHLFPLVTTDLHRAWEIYVQYRLPHHLLPSAWERNGWFVLSPATGLFALSYWFCREHTPRLLAAYGLASVTLFAVGLLFYFLGHITMLRFYWFRFPDTIVPLISFTLIALGLNYLTDTRLQQQRTRLARTLRVSLAGAGVLLLSYSLVRFPARMEEHPHVNDYPLFSPTELRPMFAWIKANTAKDATFLVDPTLSDFYIRAERAVFVSLKHVPSAGPDILEWYERIKLVNNDQPPTGPSFDSVSQLRANSNRLAPALLQRLVRSHDVDYFLSKTRPELVFAPVYTAHGYTLYKMDSQEKSSKSR
jgi:hypothetical protein